MSRERIERELEHLLEGGQTAELVLEPRLLVLYRDVPTDGLRIGLPERADVIVPVPDGYPGRLIDLAGLPVGSPFLSRVKGGSNNQGIIHIEKQDWQLASYHPHNGGGGPPWDPVRHGFHTYLEHLIAWLHCLN